MDVVARQSELLEVATHGLGRDAELAQRCDRRALGPLRELLAVLAEDQAVVDVLRRGRPERLVEPAVEVFVRAMVVPAIDVRDPELGVVDDAREMVGRRPVLAEERRPSEAVAAEPLDCGAVELLPLALADRPLVPGEAEPLEVAEDRLLPAPDVARRVGVVDPQQHPVALAAIDDGAEGVPDVERARRAGREPDAFHPANVTAARREGRAAVMTH